MKIIDRDSSILNLYREGTSRKNLAIKFSLSKPRIDQILWKLDPSIKGKSMITKTKTKDLSGFLSKSIRNKDKELIDFCKKLQLDFNSVKKINLPKDDLRFLIDSDDIEFSKAFLVEKGAKLSKDISVKNSKRSTGRSKALIEFLQTLHSDVFTAESITKSFSKFCGEEVTTNSIFSYLNTLKKHGYVKSTLKGIYELGDKLKKKNPLKDHVENVIPLKEIADKRTKVKKSSTLDSIKKPERFAVEEFISKSKIPGKALLFTTKDVHAAYKSMDSKKLSKAIQNMNSLGLIKKGKKIGQYIVKQRGDKQDQDHVSFAQEISDIDYKKLALSLIEECALFAKQRMS